MARVGTNVSYHCKPFSSEEIQQLAIKSVYEWNKARQLEQVIQATAKLRDVGGEPESMLPDILAFAASLLDAQGVLFAEKQAAGQWAVTVEAGVWTELSRAQALEKATGLAGLEAASMDDSACLLLSFDRFVFAARLPEKRSAPTSGALYLTRLFLAQARQVLDNARLRHDMQKKEKISAIGGAISMVAHDLRSPIAAILGASESLMDDDIRCRDAARDLIRGIRRSATESLDYVQDLLNFVRGDEMAISMQPEVCWDLLCELAEEARKRFRTCNFTVDVDLSGTNSKIFPELLFFVMDRAKMWRVLVNLINNAAEAPRDHPQESAPCVCLKCGLRKGKGWIAVSDNGSGIPTQIKDRLFTMFVTLNKSGGTGLGLPIVKKYCDAQSLSLNVESGSVGTTFTLSGFEVVLP